MSGILSYESHLDNWVRNGDVKHIRVMNELAGEEIDEILKDKLFEYLHTCDKHALVSSAITLLTSCDLDFIEEQDFSEFEQSEMLMSIIKAVRNDDRDSLTKMALAQHKRQRIKLIP